MVLVIVRYKLRCILLYILKRENLDYTSFPLNVETTRSEEPPCKVPLVQYTILNIGPWCRLGCGLEDNR